MPRAFCPECGSEVPVDPDGVCHVGHVVGVTAASVGPAGEFDVDFADASEPDDEPEPWVANVDRTQLGGYTPPPDAAAAAPAPPPPMPEPAPDATDTVPPPPPSAPASPPPAASVPPDEPAWTPSAASYGDDEDEPEPGIFDLGGAGPDDLAAAAAAAAEQASREPDEPEPDLWGSEERAPGATGDAPGWAPPTADAVAPPPEPPPAPVEPPAPRVEATPASGHDEEADFDLADLEAAVVEMEMEPAPADTGGGSSLDDLDALMRDDEAGSEGETVTAEIDLPPPSAPPAASRDDEQLAAPPEDRGVVGSFPRPSDAPDASRPAAPVDLSNFTAKGDKVKDDAEDRGKKSFFRLRR